MKDTDKRPVVLISGVSSGIGKAAAKRMLESGHRVFGTSRKATVGSTVDGIEMVPLDVTDYSSVDAAVAAVIAAAGRIDVLVNNAGGGILGAAEESSLAQAQELFDINFFGVIRMCRAILPHMRERRAGRIVNVTSVLGFLPAPYAALYCASKFALEGYSESLDHELRTLGIRSTLVEPAYTRTSFDQHMVMADEQITDYEGVRTQVINRFHKEIEGGDDPRTTAATIFKAATDTRPKLRYTSGKLAGRLKLLRRFAPAGMVDSGIRRQMALE